MNSRPVQLLVLCILMITFTGCEKDATTISEGSADLKANVPETSSFEFPGSIVFDISATPDGGVMVGVNEFSGSRSIQLIKNGELKKLLPLNTETNIQGIESIGAGNAFFTTAGTDQALNGELYRASNGNIRMVADLAEFERLNDPDAFEGPQWKNQQCEEEFDDNGGVVFTAGPQNNPYKVSAFDGHTALIADAAGNTVLQATTSGEVDWKVLLTPPLNLEGSYMELFQTTDGIDDITCYVQPVPTSIALDDHGFAFVGELTGATPEGLPIGLSRVWKFPADEINLVCSETEGSENCKVLINNLTSVIDIEIGPDGLLYVVQFDSNSWLSSVVPSIPWGGGSINAYDTDTGELVHEIANGLVYPGAITFDKKGNLWVLENKLFIGESAVVRRLEF